MKAKHFLGIGVVASAFSAAMAGAGCGSSTSNTGGSGGTPATTTSSSSHSSSVVTVGSGGMGGGSGGSGGAATTNTAQGMAQTLTVNGMAFEGHAENATTPDWYQFSATAGERLYIAANAVSIVNPAPSQTETNIIDTVVTVYKSDGTTVVAQDDDAYPRSNTDSQLFFEAPTTGTYYFTIQSCAAAFGMTACGSEAPTDFIYQTFVADVGMLNGMTEGSLKYSIKEAYAGTMQDGTTAKAVTIPYTVSMDEITPILAVDGDTFTAGQPQVFSFTVPSTLTPASGSRLRTEFWLQPKGTANGDGSTANVTAWVTDNSGTTVLVQADQKNYQDGDNFTDGPLDLSVPVTSGSQYFLFVQDDNTSTAASDYYFFLHTLDSGNPLQVSGQTNTSAASAQVLTVPSGETGAYFVDGNITAFAPTQYWYEVDPPSGATTLFASCSSARAGSGVQGFTMDLQGQIGASGTPMSIVPSGTVTVEAANADLSIPPGNAASGLAIPTGTTKMFLVVSATGQSATVTDNSYQCDVIYQ